MSIMHLLSRLEESGITIELAGEKLRIKAGEGTLTPALIDELKDKKGEIIELLQQVRRQDKYEAIKPLEKKEYDELSSAQERLYFLQQMEPESIAYNMPQAIPLPGGFAVERLAEIFPELIRRHEILRTSFEVIHRQAVQRVHDKIEFKIDYISGERRAEIIRDFLRPFDLSQAPLFRVGLIKEEEKKHILMVDMHHIVTDGASLELFEKEFMRLYQGEKLTPLRLRYKDYAKWQKDLARSGDLKRQEEYWLKQFAAGAPVLNLPVDYERPAIQSFEGTSFQFETGEKEAAALKRAALDNGATLYMVLVAVYNIFLARICGQEDLVVGTPVTGRMHADLEKIVGMFVNTLALRNYPAREKTFQAFLKEVKERTLEAFENQEYQFEDLVKRVSTNRDPGRNPLFDVMFAYQNVPDEPPGEIPGEKDTGLEKRGLGYEFAASQFDLCLDAVERRGKLLFVLEYNTRLFKEETIEQFAVYFNEIVSMVIEDKNIKLGEIAVSHDFVDIETGISDEEGDFGF